MLEKLPCETRPAYNYKYSRTIIVKICRNNKRLKERKTKEIAYSAQKPPLTEGKVSTGAGVMSRGNEPSQSMPCGIASSPEGGSLFHFRNSTSIRREGYVYGICIKARPSGELARSA